MNVCAFSSATGAGWRWRIVDDRGDGLEESHGSYPSIAAAVAEGAQRLRERDDRDVASMPMRVRRPSYRPNR